MSHKVFIRHNSECKGEWKINEALDLDRLNCPHCGKNDVVDYILKDQREKWISKRV